LYLRIPGLGFFYDFAYEVYWPLDSVDMARFVSLDHKHRANDQISCGYIEEQVLVRLRCSEDGW